ncbi:mechanosensitive ion channel protein 1, mitochondrial isoform X1 [Phoenix dactylifera]|uniref:Mechanosensitive ion channel protein 1, mitochondrial isoform X1 n=1 Tax=Phoenix dactylifera TaxID=42345 RepID=A0A8B9A1C5_PHODC|nr:mechanosensitive ion channel protein 1, mitochondrial isoform X1 [Phoenix dactylifera]XP_008803925.2 mechanosensitive ion channel protein 1, mitochondrial isoform X1 [Phoenix dactylifera]XP_038979442.1 mechanosensitive ion channel protein 1, mitochondrial isoform X1 [Phoenix dactylifera]
MSGVSTILRGSFHAAIGPFKTRSIFPYTSCLNVSRFSAHSLSKASGLFPPNNHKAVDWPLQHVWKRKDRVLPLSSLVEAQSYKIDSPWTDLNRSSDNSQLKKNTLQSRCNAFPSFLCMSYGYRAYSSHAGDKQDGLQNVVTGTALAKASDDKTTDSIENEWVDMLNHVRQSVVDAAVNAENKAKELSDQINYFIQQLYDSDPYLEKVIVPVGGTLSATVLAWFVMPRILRKFHKYASRSPLALLSRRLTTEQVSYEKSLWGALEDPARYLVTFMAFSQLGTMIAPTTEQYLSQAWRGAIVLSFVWFLHRWKTNFFTSALASQATVGLERDKLLTLEKVSSVGLIVLGVMALAEASGVAVQSILTVGGVGGVATAFAARDILGNLLSGLSLQFSKPFSVGDQIKAGSVEGQVMEMGLTSTSLLNPEKFPVIVPNSLFSSQVIVNKSRAQWRASVTKIPIRIHDIEKIPLISEEIKSMLHSSSKVFLEKDVPYCYLSRIENSFAELTLGCNLKSMRRDEHYATEQDILLQAARIIRQHGAELGGTLHDYTNC